MILPIWDYDRKKLQKSKQGRLLILERLINYGIYPKDKKKISLSAVKRNWNTMSIEPKRRKFLQYLIWKT